MCLSALSPASAAIRGTRAGASRNVERDALERGDLAAYWTSRAQAHDPGARVGMALWAGSIALRHLVSDPSPRARSYWQPQLGSALAFVLRGKLDGVRLPPRGADELVRYWVAMGRAAELRVQAAIRKHTPHHATTSAALHARVREIALALARAHAAAVDEDLARGAGAQPGVLSLEQIAAYHHRVFAAHGLPPTAFGGTPYAWIPDFIELCFAGRAYAKGADPRP